MAALHSYVPVSHAYVKFCGGQPAHENNEYFTPQKLPAIRYIGQLHKQMRIIGLIVY